MAKLELKIDSREVWAAYADRLYSGDKLLKSLSELLQNSVDAGATRVTIDWTEQEEDTWTLKFSDNGCGMSVDVFLNRFLCLGGKGEAEGERTGGNGVAKAVILFNAQVQDFTIHSVHQNRSFKVTQQDILSGAELTDEAMTKGSGVDFVIRYKKGTYVNLKALETFLCFARTPKTKIIFNQKPLSFNGKLSDLHTEIVGYPVYEPLKNDYYKGYYVVLSNGLPQFMDWNGGEETYLVDFTPTTFRDFTPSRERLSGSGLEAAFRRLKDRVRYEQENPITAKQPVQKVQKRFTYNLKTHKTKRETVKFLQPDHAPEFPHLDNLPVLENDRRAALVTSGIRSEILSKKDKMDDTLETLIPCRGIIFEDRSSARREWHPEKSPRVRKILALMDRYIEIFEYEFSDLEVANIGLLRNSQSHDAHWSSDDKAVLIDVEKLSGNFQVVALTTAYVLTHELAHRWERSHNERFTSMQARLLDVLAARHKEFARARKSVRKVK